VPRAGPGALAMSGIMASSSIHTATVTLECGCRGRGVLARVPGGQRPGHPGLARDSEHWHHDGLTAAGGFLTSLSQVEPYPGITAFTTGVLGTAGMGTSTPVVKPLAGFTGPSHGHGPGHRRSDPPA
jgi:hypothetical protein